MRSFFRFFAERNLLANLFTVMILLLGTGAMMTIKRDQYPDVAIGQLIVTTVYPGASPEDVELNVTDKIEDELRRVSGIRQYASVSMENVSSIRIDLDYDLDDPEQVKDEIRRAVNRVTDLPGEVENLPHVLDIKTPFQPFIEVGVVGEVDYRTLREYARILEKKLEGVSGVNRLDRIGYRYREVRVEVDPAKLDRYQLPLHEALGSIAARNIRGSGGTLESYTSEKTVVTLAQFRSPDEVGDVIVRSTFDGPQVTIADLAVITDDFKEETTASRVNGRNAISFALYNNQSADVLRTVERVRELIERETKLLPPGVELILANDASGTVERKLSIVFANGALGLAMVLALLTLFLNFRTAFWVSMGIPVAILGTVALLPAFDVFLDTIVLTSLVIVIGIIVDDAIIVSEAIYARMERGMSPLDAAVEGMTAVYKPVLTTILTTFLAFAPMFFMPGMLGKFVVVIPLAVSLALLVSWLEVTVALPSHIIGDTARGKRQVVRDHSEALMSAVGERFRRAILPMLRWRYGVTLLFVAVFVGSLGYASRYMDIILFPTKGAERFVIAVEAPIGSSLAATGDVMEKMEAIVRKLPQEELASYVTRVGMYAPLEAEPRISERFGTVIVSLSPWSARSRSADEIVEDLRTRTQTTDIGGTVIFSIDSGGPPAGKPVTVRVMGGNDAERRSLADEVAAWLADREGVKDVDRDDKPGKEEVRIKIDYAKLARLGLTVADVARTVRIAYDGEVATSVRYGDEDVDFRVMLDESVRRRVDALTALAIPNRQGRLVRLGEVAHLTTATGPADVHHFDRDRTVTVTADVDQNTTTPLAVTDALLDAMNVERNHPGMRLTVGGEAQETQQSMQGLYVAFIIGSIGIYFLLTLLFNSLTQPLIVMVAIPFGLTGVIIAFALHGEPFGFLAMLGAVGMAGVVVNDSLVLVDHVNNLRRSHPEKPLTELVARGTADRLRAILMTSATTVAGLLPLAYGIGGADLYMGPMALALGWGILFATPLTLGLIPSVYLIFTDIGRLTRWGVERLGKRSAT
jgi:multidrug efflux pump subunit AcrB